MSYTRQVGEAANPSVNGQNNRANVYMLDGVANFETFGNAYAVLRFSTRSRNSSAVAQRLRRIWHGIWRHRQHRHQVRHEPNARSGVLVLEERCAERAPVQPRDDRSVPAESIWRYRRRPDHPQQDVFFGAAQIFRFSTPGASFYNVPTAAQLGGDFSQSGRDIFDPGLTAEDPANPGAFIRPQFANNRIPQSRLDQSILGYLQATGLPQPTVTERAQFNAVDNRSNTVEQEEWQVKVDHHFSASDTAWFRFSKLDQAGQSSGGRAGLVNSNEMDAVNFSGSYVHIFSPSMTGQFQFGRSISDIPTFREFEGLDAAAIAQQAGFPSGIYEYRDGPVLSGISAANYFGGTPVITTNRPANNYQIKGDMSVVKGKHTLRFGGDFMFATMSRTQASHGVTFTEVATADLANSATTGDSVASMILNYAESSSRRNIVESLRFGGNQGVYFQDSWKATPKLTVNLGLRFDYAWVPQYGTVEDGNIYTGNANTDTGQYAVIKVPGPCAELGGAPCIPTPDGSLPENVISVGADSVLFPGRGPMLGPRVGLAYRLSDKTTLRFSAAWCTTTLPVSIRVPAASVATGPTFRLSASESSPNQHRATAPQVTAQNPMLGQSDVPPPTPFNTQWWFVDPEFEQAYSMQWNFGVQHQLMRNTVVEANYVGSGNRDLSLGGRRNTAVTAGPGDPKDRMRFPYMRPTYFEKSIGRSSYNSLQLSMKRSFTNGLAATAAYTWAKSIDIGCSGFFGTEGCSIQNEYDLNGQRSVSANDIPHYFVGSLVYDVPFGHGRRFGSDIPTAADHIIGGWQFNALVNFRGGLPYHVTVPGDIANVGNPWTYIRANIIGDHQLGNPTPERWINTSAFEAPSQFTFGTLGRNTLRPRQRSSFRPVAVQGGIGYRALERPDPRRGVQRVQLHDVQQPGRQSRKCAVRTGHERASAATRVPDGNEDHLLDSFRIRPDSQVPKPRRPSRALRLRILPPSPAKSPLEWAGRCGSLSGAFVCRKTNPFTIADQCLARIPASDPTIRIARREKNSWWSSHPCLPDNIWNDTRGIALDPELPWLGIAWQGRDASVVSDPVCHVTPHVPNAGLLDPRCVPLNELACPRNLADGRIDLELEERKRNSRRQAHRCDGPTYD